MYVLNYLIIIFFTQLVFVIYFVGSLSLLENKLYETIEVCMNTCMVFIFKMYVKMLLMIDYG